MPRRSLARIQLGGEICLLTFPLIEQGGKFWMTQSASQRIAITGTTRLRGATSQRNQHSATQELDTQSRRQPHSTRRGNMSLDISPHRARRKSLDDSVGIATHRNHRDDPVAGRYITT